MQGMEQRHQVPITEGSKSSDFGAVVKEDAPAERPAIDLFKSIFESESESESESDGDGRDQEDENASTPVQPPELPADLSLARKVAQKQESIGKRLRRRGYGSDSSDNSSGRGGSSGSAGQVESRASSVAGLPTSNKKAEDYESGRHSERRRNASSDRERESNSNRKRSSSKHKHKKDKSAKKEKHRKHHKRKRRK